mmetsp:Transcript_23518/g.35714  ORF Transcript_23518/g.35714 Transcript_23518/m.35714 type:complete len:294 (-) Transcript_23518:344-1225(-)
MWAKENYWCDQEAGNYCDLTSKQSYDGSSLPLYKSPWTIWVKEILVLDDLHEVIDEIIQEANAINYWRKHKYSASSLKDVNWPAIATTYKGLPFSRQTWSTKQASDWAPTNKNMKRWRLGRTEKCPFCGKLEDSLHHVQTCSHPEPSSYRRSKLKDLPSKLMKLHTSPPAVTALLAGLRKVWNEVPNISSYFTANWSQHITDSQSTIGWWNLICGKWSTYWLQHHRNLYRLTNSTRSPRRWQSSVIRLLLNTAWDFWQFWNDMQHTRLQKIVSPKTYCRRDPLPMVPWITDGI